MHMTAEMSNWYYFGSSCKVVKAAMKAFLQENAACSLPTTWILLDKICFPANAHFNSKTLKECVLLKH